MMKKAKQVLVIFLAFLMFFQTFEPGLRAIAYARTESESVGTETGFGLWPDDLEDVASIDGTGAEYVLRPEEIEEEIHELTGDDVIGELYHLREANVKHFRMSDGSFIAVTYDTDVHFQDEEGNWIDIDNSLALELAEDVQVTAETEQLLDAIEELLEDGEEIAVEDIQELLEELDLDIEIEDIVFTTEDTMLDIHFNLGSGCEETPDFVVEHEDYSIGLSLIGAEEQVAEIVPMELNLDAEDNSIAAAVRLPNLTSRIIYRDVLPGVDLEYVIHGHDIKENIIVNHLLDSHTFFFELDLDNLRPVRNEDGSISLMSRDTDEEMFLIPAPFMWDADGEFSTAVRYEIVPAGSFHSDDFVPETDEHGVEETPQEDYEYARDYPDVELDYTESEEIEPEAFSAQLTAAMAEYELEALDLSNYQDEIDPSDFPEIEEWDYANADQDNRYLFVVIVDEEWMHDADRAFPVTIDPPIVVRWENGRNISTTFVTEHVTSSTWSNGQMEVGRSSFGGIARNNRMYLRIDPLPPLPTGATVVRADIQLGQQPQNGWPSDQQGFSGTAALHVAVHEASAYWSYRNLVWGTQPPINPIVLDYTTITASPGGAWRGWNITSAVKSWHENPQTNHGLVFRPIDEPASSLARFAGFNSNSHPALRPIFILQYRSTIGLAPHLTYATQGLGRAGTGHVGDYSGQLTVVNPVVSHASAALPFTLSMVYNSAHANRHFTQDNSALNLVGATQNTRDFSAMRMGHGWKLTAQETVVEQRLRDVNNVERTWLVWNTATGTEHYFQRSTTDTTDRYYRDEDGLGLRIWRDGTTFIMRDDQNNRRYFFHGTLGQIIDRNGNRIRFIYNDTSAFATNGTGWRPMQWSGNRLLQVRQQNSGGAELIIATLHYENNRLNRINDRAGNRTYFFFEDTRNPERLTRIRFPDGFSAYYTYDNDGRMTEARDGESRRGITYDWGAENQVTAIRSFALNTNGTRVMGTRLYRNGRMPGITIYRDPGPDGLTHTVDDIVEHVIFDHVGRTVNYFITNYTPNGSTQRDVLAASTTRYVRPPGNQPRQTNRVESTATIGIPAVNLLRNAGMEEGASHWTTSGGGLSVVNIPARTTGHSAAMAAFGGFAFDFDLGLSEYAEVEQRHVDRGFYENMAALQSHADVGFHAYTEAERPYVDFGLSIHAEAEQAYIDMDISHFDVLPSYIAVPQSVDFYRQMEAQSATIAATSATTHTLTFYLDGGTVGGSWVNVVHSIPHGQQIGVNRVPVPVRTGHALVGWRHSCGTISTREQVGGFFLNNSATLIAHWTPVIDRTVTFNFNGNGQANVTRNLWNGIEWVTFRSWNHLAGIPTSPTRAGFSFVGWFNTSAATGGTNINNMTGIVGTHTFWARWTPATTRNIRYNDNFTGTNVLIRHNATTNAFVQNDATVTFNTVRTGTATDSRYNQTIGATGSVPTRAGHVFSNLRDGRLAPSGGNAQGPTADRYWMVSQTQTASVFGGWFATAANANAHTSQTGRVLPSHQVPAGTTQLEVFARWYPTRTITFNPQSGTWPAGAGATTGTLTRRAVTVATPSGSVLGTRAANYGQVLNAHNQILAGVAVENHGIVAVGNPTRAGFAFSGWWTAATGGTQVLNTTALPTGNVTLHARWTAVPQQVVTFNPQGGTWPTPAGGTANQTRTIPRSGTYSQAFNVSNVLQSVTQNPPTRAGFTFNGWWTAATGGTRIQSTTAVSTAETRTLHAQWTVVQGNHLLTFNLNGGDVNGSTANVVHSIPHGTQVGVNRVPIPVRANHTFTGWLHAGGYTSTREQVGGFFLNNSATLTAQWAPTSSNHTLTFNLNGGNVNGSAINVVHSIPHGTQVGINRVPEPVRANHTFAGWLHAGGYTSTRDQVGRIILNNTATLTALWTPVNHLLTFNLNGGNVNGSTANVVHSVPHGQLIGVGRVPIPVRTNYTFAGWRHAYGAISDRTQVGAFHSNNPATLVAQWTIPVQTGTRSQQAVGTGANFNSWYQQSVHLVANTTYTFSAYVNTSAVTRFTNTTTSGVALQVLNGTSQVAISAPVSFNTDPNVNGGWQRISLTVRPTQTGQHNLRVLYRHFSGTAWVDDIQFEAVPVGAGSGPSSPNLVQNGGFEVNAIATNVNGAAVGTWNRNSGNSSILQNQERLGGTHGLRMVGHPTRQEFVFQDVPINLPGTETFVLSGWAKANSVPTNPDDVNPRTATNNGASFGMMARITYANGTTEDHHLRFNPDVQAGAGIAGWQFGSAPIVPRQPSLTVQTIRVYIHYNFNANVAWFDNISLVREAAQRFTYDANGNLIGVQESGLRDTTMQNDNAGNLIRQVTQGHGTFHYTYDSNNHNLTRVISGPANNTTAHHLMMEIQYNPSGSATRSTMTGHRRNLLLDHPFTQLVSTAEYSADGHLLRTATDVNGITRTLQYSGVQHEMRGIPSRITDGRGHHIDYTINNQSGRLTQVRQTLGSQRIDANYTYSAGNLTRINRVGFNGPAQIVAQDYNFQYNEFGQMARIDVGGRVLKSYGYNRDHTLNHRIYGGRYRVEYTYDHLGRVATVTHRTGTAANSPIQAVFTYTYTGDGQLHSIHDSSTNRTVEFTYDPLGRLVSYVERTWNGSVSTIRQSGHQRYDHAGRVTNFAYDIPSIPRAERRQYASIFAADTGNLVDLWLPTGNHWHLQYRYDHLHRLHSRTLSGGVSWETRFMYRTRSGNDSSLQVEHMTHTIAGTHLRYQYWYDTIGQITRWRDPISGSLLGQGTASVYHHYTYDQQNQLTREVISRDEAGRSPLHSFTYEYDTYGNIRRREHHTGALTLRTTLYYDNTQWRDLLTRINLNGAVTNISYDGTTGNPLNWHGGATLTWARGRQLQRLQRTGVDVTFTYDHTGIRTGKRVNRNGQITEHTFYTQNGIIVAETRRHPGGAVDTLEFIYDESGRPVQLIFNGRIYNYVLNLQGDVQQLRRTDGTVVATYLYNAWGELIASSGTMADNNPLRYRSYFFDVSTGLYYLQSRYYDPVIGRFINADATEMIFDSRQNQLRYNLFAYCDNNPVNFIDPGGFHPLAAIGADMLFRLGAAALALIASFMIVEHADEIVAGAGAIVESIAAPAVTAPVATAPPPSTAAPPVSRPSTGGSTPANPPPPGNNQNRGFRSWTQGNFRHNLQVFSGQSGQGMHAHHVFPVQFSSQFLRAGININLPWYGTWLAPTFHRAIHAAGYNARWFNFFQTIPSPTAQQIFNFGRQLAREFGFRIFF